MATTSFGNFGFSGMVKRQRSRERIMPKSQQVAKIRQILSNRGAGVDTLDLVDDLVDPTVGYEDNKREILRRVGFDAYTQRSAQAMVHEQCPSAIADCATNGIDACEFACEECRDTPSCRKLTQKAEPPKKKVVKPTKTIKAPKVTKKPKVTTKPKKPTPTPITKSKSKFNEKVLTDAQIQHARKHGYVNITIGGVKKRVSKKNFAARKRTIYWYKSGGKVSLKMVRG